MKRIKIEIQITLLSIFIAAAVIGSGYLVYQSLSHIVDSIHKEARPDFKLLLIKDIANDLNEVENSVRLYSLTEDPNYIYAYDKLNDSIQNKLNDLEDYAIPGSNEIQVIDSIRLLTNRKLIIWSGIRSLHNQKENTHSSFTNLYSKIDTAIIQPDTIKFEPEAKKGFFKRLFSKQDTASHAPIIIDKSKEKEIIKQEIAGIEQQITDQNQQLQAKEKILLEKNIQVTDLINQQIRQLETNEQRRLETKTEEADFMAAQTYRRLTIFTVAAVVLLMIVLILFFRNVKQNREYQQILKRAKAEAESLAKAKEMFVATVSHEMRTPVNAIFGLTEQLLQKQNPPEVTEDLKVVHSSARHLITLVNDTLDFSKIESQKLKIEQVDFAPDEIFREIYTLHKHVAAAKSINLRVENATAKSLVLNGDPVRLKQILINLITNAIKFTDKGEVVFSVDLEKTSENTCQLRMEVTDTGIGISNENLPRIFDEFVQLDTDLKQKHRGAGLGLAIVKKLVDLQGGKIEVDSTPGKGTRFSLQIPYVLGKPGSITTQEEARPATPESFSSLRFLLVDDEEFNLYLLKNILKKWGVNYTEAHNGQQAVELAQENKYDLIFMDMRMPVMDGYEASRTILETAPDTKIIALTATGRPEDIQKSKEAGMLGFLQKPFSENDLFEAVTRLIPSYLKPFPESQPPLNLDELEKMAGGDKAFFKEMIEIFINSSEKGLAAIQKGIQANDWEAVSEAAHKLAAPSKHMQAMTLYKYLKDLENIAGTTVDQTRVENIVRQITEEVTSINQLLKQKLAGK